MSIAANSHELATFRALRLRLGLTLSEVENTV